MPSIILCPHCRSSMLIESLENPAQRLACPKCSTHFALSNCLDSAVEAPPLAIPISSDSGPPAGAAVASAPHAAESLGLAPQQAVAAVRQPNVDAEGGASTYAIAGAGAEVEQAANADVPAWEAMGQHDGAGSRSTTARARSRPQKPGVLGHLLGIVLGGVMGLSLGYWILLWISGRGADFLDVWDSLPRWSLPRDERP